MKQLLHIRFSSIKFDRSVLWFEKNSDFELRQLKSMYSGLNVTERAYVYVVFIDTKASFHIRSNMM